MCNTPPSETVTPNYWLNRNSIYRFLIRIKNSSSTSKISRGDESIQRSFLRSDGVQVIDVNLKNI